MMIFSITVTETNYFHIAAEDEEDACKKFESLYSEGGPFSVSILEYDSRSDVEADEIERHDETDQEWGEFVACVQENTAIAFSDLLERPPEKHRVLFGKQVDEFTWASNLAIH